MYSEEQIKKRVSEIAAQISVDYQSKDVLLVCVLRGSIIFTADLIREISIPVKVDTIAVSSYGNSTESSGVVRLIKDLDETIKDVHVLIVEDIIDSGLTLQYLINMLKQRNPASVKVCTLLDKRERRMSNVIPDYAGFIIPNEFVIGYGMDYGEYYRQLPYIGVLKPEVYQ
ncbi:hypoxanthine phosphoribosyltransferase [Clostridium sp. 'deep sea']|uniref:hypoxanthine phosphoribosyltransferase n=1 Tax=Clostridium sp. 'deep sea' TaxID=2779445 RepID=UPI001A9AE42A|nr:hypoxanthine phosphoribosyltransferase [Clostridium sp. 'deep sea']